MTSAEIYQWMTDPSLLTKASLPELKQLVTDYPCFHAVRMLYLKNLAMLGDVRIDKELKKMAVCVPNRRQLFLLIDDNSHKAQLKMVVSETEAAMPVTVDSCKKANPPAVSQRAYSHFSDTVASSDYIRWLEDHTEDLPTKEGADNRLKYQDIIDSVIENGLIVNTAASSTADVENDGEKQPDSEKKSMPDMLDNTSLKESYFTETLARVYISQKRYDKALEIFRVLNLRYPEKSIYFAAQIKALEKIIHN